MTCFLEIRCNVAQPTLAIFSGRGGLLENQRRHGFTPLTNECAERPTRLHLLRRRGLKTGEGSCWAPLNPDTFVSSCCCESRKHLIAARVVQIHISSASSPQPLVRRTAAITGTFERRPCNRSGFDGFHMQHRKREFINHRRKLQWGRNKPAV